MTPRCKRTLILLAVTLGVLWLVVAATPRPPVPKMVQQSPKGAEFEASRAIVPSAIPASNRLAIVSWSNPVPSNGWAWAATNWQTGLIGSTNLRTWNTQAVLPYAPSCSVTFTNPPSPSYWRAFNRSLTP